jgi:penicillin-binding protein 1C
MRRLVLAGAAALAMAALALALSLTIAPFPLQDFGTVREAWRASDAWLLARSGGPLSRVRIDHERRRGAWIALGEVSPALLDAVLASEDRRFRSHAGVDWLAMMGAVKQTAWGDRRGGSTLTMQLASYLYPELESGGRRSFIHKWRQMRQALALERAWRKDEILEAWLNLTPFRGELEGIDAAARALFRKRAQGLDRAESALLAALARAPNAPGARVARRACALLDDRDACSRARTLAAAGLHARTLHSELDGDAPHLARRLLTTAGERRVSTLDARVQRHAVETLQRHLRELEGRGVEDGAVLVLDNARGEVLAWVGSSGELSRASHVDGVTARRQPGSTLKPFLYALAIERRLLTAASLLDDTPLAVTLPTGLYVPQNYDRAFRGRVSLRSALAASLNVPAVRTLALLGYEPFHRQLRALGFASLERDAGHYGYALALGGADVMLLELANAYRTLANGGRSSPVRVELLASAAAPERPISEDMAPPSAADTTQAIDERAAFIVGDILADPAARAITFGLANPLATRYRASVKTGTSKDMRDNWAVGYTSLYTVAVWVGNFSGAAMRQVSGVDGAAPVWREIMDFLHEGHAVEEGEAPAGLVRQRIEYSGALEPARVEWFLAGTERARIVAVESGPARARIMTPAAGAIYALDPDIPQAHQRIAITARHAPPGAVFVLQDGDRAPAQAPFLWLPQPGIQEIALVDARGQELDRVRIVVRGLRGAAAASVTH